MAKLSAAAVEELKQIANDATKDPVSQIPGTSIAIINKNGELLFNYAAGKIGVDSDKPMTTENTFWIASCTKISASIIVLQAVEKGLVSLDSAEDVEKWCPELKNTPIIKDIGADGSITLVPKKNKITLRHLLTHTAGFGYSFFEPTLHQFAKLFGTEELISAYASVDKFPLVHEPGEKWTYGVGIDWAVNVVSRAEGKSFQTLLKEQLFDPLEFTSVSAAPCDKIKKNLVHMHQRDLKTGKISHIEHPPTWPLHDSPDIANQAYQSGGAGIFAKPSEYVRVFAALINDGVYAPNGARILRPETVKSVFTNQIPQWPDFARQGIYPTEPTIANALPEIFQQPENPPQGWGLSLFLNTVPTPWGRGAYSGFWCGIANLYYWIDPETGIAGFVANQLYPFGDPSCLKLWIDVEIATYKGLQK